MQIFSLAQLHPIYNPETFTSCNLEAVAHLHTDKFIAHQIVLGLYYARILEDE